MKMDQQSLALYQNRQLFLNDYAIKDMEDVRRVLHQPHDQRPVMTPDVSRGQTQLQSKSPLWWNP